MTRAAPYLWASAITAIVAAPWLTPGFIFGTDWPGPRFFRWPAELSGSAPIEALLSLVSSLVSAELTGKLLILACLFVAASTAYFAVPFGDFVPRAAASLIYVLNPFVYGRLHYGQFFLLAAYAVLPLVALRTYRLLAAPTFLRAIWLAATVTVVGSLAVHLLLPVGLLLSSAVVAALISQRVSPRYVVRLGSRLAVASVAMLAAGSYWLIPYLAGKSYESQIIAGAGPADLAAYRAVGDPTFGLVPNLLGLYGFWAEGVHRFPPMKGFVPGWFAVLLALLALAAIGTTILLVTRNEVVRGFRWWIAALVVTAIIGLFLEVAAVVPQLAPVVGWLDSVFPPYRGMRDSGKWAAILAMVYAQLIPLGVVGIRSWLSRVATRKKLSETGGALVAAIALGLPIYYGNGLLYGMHGQIQPSNYPQGWYAADRLMVADSLHDRALFLPWHLYLRLSFVRNVNSVIATPAPTFFAIPIVASGDPEVPGIAPPNDPDQRMIATLVTTGGSADWARVLAARNIKYVLVANEIDSEQFAYLAHQPGFVRILGDDNIVLYRNELLP
ncbi:MAG: hypothetical protein QOH92_1670 [Chloroflexota bacterium]|jgi:hypothetical protein|nr:hypothetical protein [Chloroflexota bacterium]